MTAAAPGLLDSVEERLYCVSCVIDRGKMLLCPEADRPAVCRYAANWLDPDGVRPKMAPHERRSPYQLAPLTTPEA